METLRIDIINPKAKQLLKDLADMNLIAFSKGNSEFISFLEKLRAKSDSAPSLDEITKEIETVRSKRHES